MEGVNIVLEIDITSNMNGLMIEEASAQMRTSQVGISSTKRAHHGMGASRIARGLHMKETEQHQKGGSHPDFRTAPRSRA